MSELESEKQGFPWSVLLTTAAVGTLAFILMKKARERGVLVPESVESTLDACARAAEALESRLSESTGFSLAG